MIQGSTVRKSDHPIDHLFLDRWSPRAMSGEEISQQELLVLFEAARWAPSSYNNQPWRILYARRHTEHWEKFFNLLAEGNKAWAGKAAALLLFLSKTTFDHNGKPSLTHSFDAGAAWENLALQGCRMGLVIHAMQGFDYERAKADLGIPDGFQVEAMAVVGKPGKAEDLPGDWKAKESPNSRRKISQTAFEGPFPAAHRS